MTELIPSSDILFIKLPNIRKIFKICF